MSSPLPSPAGPAPAATDRAEGLPADPSFPPPPPPRARRWAWYFLLLFVVGLAAVAPWLWRQWQARQEWQQAQDALRRHDLAAASEHLDRYLRHRPADPAGWFLTARTARRRGEMGRAEELLTRCQELGGVTDATRLEWDLIRVQQGHFGDIAARLKRTIPPQHPDAPVVLEALARGFQKTDRLADVLEACTLWASVEPDHPWPWLWRGAVFEQLGNFHDALADYRKALDAAPDDRDVRLTLAGLFLRGRRPADAAGHYEHVLARSPDDAEAQLGLASCRIEQGRPADALALLTASLDGSAPSARALALRGRAALELRDAAGAVGWLERAMRLAPDDAEVLHQYARALRATGRRTEADGVARRLEALRKDLERLEQLVRIVSRAPDDAGPRHEAGVIALRIGRDADGLRWLNGALRARGDHRPTHAALADYYTKKGDPRAETHHRQAKAP